MEHYRLSWDFHNLFFIAYREVEFPCRTDVLKALQDIKLHCIEGAFLSVCFLNGGFEGRTEVLS
uniref:Uncharacterized protein n=1 Tax=Anguilla anguilla TaxID=7936 RepID=A0A0E9SXI2_ANGAN